MKSIIVSLAAIKQVEQQEQMHLVNVKPLINNNSLFEVKTESDYLLQELSRAHQKDWGKMLAEAQKQRDKEKEKEEEEKNRMKENMSKLVPCTRENARNKLPAFKLEQLLVVDGQKSITFCFEIRGALEDLITLSYFVYENKAKSDPPFWADYQTFHTLQEALIHWDKN